MSRVAGAVRSTVGLRSVSAALGGRLRELGLTLATAESCTGGLIGSIITAVPGSSDYYVGGAVSYANLAKARLADVDPAIIEQHGAVSEETARAMADGIRQRLSASVAISATGIAGPGGGSADKPVGLVYVGIATPERTTVHRYLFGGSRDEVRARTAEAALRGLLLALGADA